MLAYGKIGGKLVEKEPAENDGSPTAYLDPQHEPTKKQVAKRHLLSKFGIA